MSFLIGLREVTVRYPGTRALDRVSIDVVPGEVLGVVGANGSGKTTLLNVVTGQRRPTSGSVVGPDGDRLVFKRPAAALERGIVLVPQDPLVAPTLTVWENLILGQVRLGHLAPGRAARRAARARLSDVLPHVDPDMRAGDLRKADRAVLGISRALLRRPRLLALDEPTAVLGEFGIRLVDRIVREVAAAGGSVVVVSHRLRDIVRLADRVAVLADGSLKLDSPTAEVSVEEIVDSLSAGRTAALPASVPRVSAAAPGEEILSVSTDRAHSGLEASGLTVSSGEIVGVVGMAGSGRTRLCRLVAAAGGDPRGIWFRGGPLPVTTRAARRGGIAYIPEDRLNEGLFPPLSIAHNIEAGGLARDSLARIVPFGPRRGETQKVIEAFGIAAASQCADARSLSGGNAQRLVLARELMSRPVLLVADEPTQGVDRAGRAAIHRLMRDFAAGGGGILVVSSEFEELQEIASRLYVMVDGRVVAEVPPETSYARLLVLASGVDGGGNERT